MVVGVVVLATLPGDDAPRPAVAHARRLHRVLAIVAAAARRQLALAVAEHCAVALIWEGPAGLDERERLARLRRQLLELHLAREGERSAASQQECERERPHQLLGFSR